MQQCSILSLQDLTRSQSFSVKSFLSSIIDIGPGVGRVVEKMPQEISLRKELVIMRVDFTKELWILLKNCGFSLQQVRNVVVGVFDYFQLEIKLDDFVFFPAIFTYDLESTTKPRHRMVAKKGLKCSLILLTQRRWEHSHHLTRIH